MHGFDNSVSLTIAPLSVMYLKAIPMKKTAEYTKKDIYNINRKAAGESDAEK